MAGPAAPYGDRPPTAFCPACGRTTVSPTGPFCPNCGKPLPLPSPPTGWTAPLAAPVGRIERFSRTRDALLWMIVGFALIWIPYADFLGGIFLLIGIYWIYRGRFEAPRPHATYVDVAGTLILFYILATVVVTVWATVSILSVASATGEPLSQIGSTLQNVLEWVFVVSFVSTIAAAAGFVLLVYSLADRFQRSLLWGGFGLWLVLSGAILAFLVPRITSAIQQATSGSQVNTGPITGLQQTATIFEILNIVPALWFLIAYYQIRKSLVGELRFDQPGAA